MFFCLVFAMPLCASVYMCLVVTCWERADLLALVCGVVLLTLCMRMMHTLANSDDPYKTLDNAEFHHGLHYLK